VTATPKGGASTALLRLDDRKTLGVDTSVMLAVVAGGDLGAKPFSVNAAGTSERNVAKRHYVTVPAGTKALQLELGGLAAGTQTRFIAFHPYGLPIDSTSSLACYSNRGTDATCNSRKRVYANPQAGIWEVVVESRRTSPVAGTPYVLTGSALGVTVDPADQTVTDAAAAVTWQVTNDFGLVTGSASGGSLGSALADTPTIKDLEVVTRTVVVPEGAERLDVSIGSPSDTGADLDLFVTGPSGARQSADGDSEEAVSYVNPKAGTYTVTIDGYAVPSGTTTYAYRDVFTAARLGTLEVTSGPLTLKNGESGTVTGKLVAKETVAAGRALAGTMRFASDGGALLGTGTVTVAP
jgi:hypothetical protein